MRTRFICLLGAALALWACKADVPSGVFACDHDDECPSGMRCRSASDAGSDAKRCRGSDDSEGATCSNDLWPVDYDGKPVWTTLDIALCDILCPTHSSSCMKDSCTHGVELAECVGDSQLYCSFQPGGSCRSLWLDFVCCGQDNCGTLTGDAGSSCRSSYCDAELSAGANCLSDDDACRDTAWDDCSALAKTTTTTPNDAGVRIDGGTDAGIKTDAGLAPRDAAVEAGLDAGVKVDAGVADAARPDAASDASGLVAVDARSMFLDAQPPGP